MSRRDATFIDDLPGLIAVAAAVLVLYATGIWGPAISNDSFSYLVSAQALLDGRGLIVPRVGEFVPMTSWPPVYPAAISSISFTGVDIKEAARLLGVFLMAINILLAARLIRGTAKGPFPVFLGATVLAFSPMLLRAHSHIWSEPLFFLLMLLALLILARYIARPAASLAFLFGIAAALACLTRYAGVSIIAAGLVSILILSPGPIRRRWFHAAIAAATAILPLALWLFRNSLAAGSTANRGISLRVPTLSHVQSLAGDMSLLLLPKALPPTVRTVAIFFAVAAFIVLVIAFLRRRPAEHPSPTILLLFIASYEILIAAMCLFVDPTILAESRIQLPAVIAAVIFTFATAPSLVTGKTARLAFVCAAAFALLGLGRGIDWARTSHAAGQSFSSARWSADPLISHIRNLPSGTTIFSNSPQLIFAQTGRVAWFLPSHTDFSRRSNPRWTEDAGQFARAFPPATGCIAIVGYYNPADLHEIASFAGPGLITLAFPSGTILSRPAD